MKKPIRDTLQPLAERICAELCRWPYIAPSQDVLDVICDECEVMAGLEKIMTSRAGRPKAEPPKPEGKAARAITSSGSPHGAAAEKRAVLERLTAYRQARGLGSLRELAKVSGVRESTLYDMLDCAVVPMEDWRAVGAALDRLGVGM